MKKIILIILFAFALPSILCASEKSKMLKEFVKKVIVIDENQISGAEPLVKLQSILAEKADKTITIDKENIQAALTEAKSYTKNIVIVGKHTIAIVEDLADCKSSGSWGACMPMSKALTQKSGSLSEKSDYINNLIGIPDTQIRTMYFFK